MNWLGELKRPISYFYQKLTYYRCCISLLQSYSNIIQIVWSHRIIYSKLEPLLYIIPTWAGIGISRCNFSGMYPTPVHISHLSISNTKPRCPIYYMYIYIYTRVFIKQLIIIFEVTILRYIGGLERPRCDLAGGKWHTHYFFPLSSLTGIVLVSRFGIHFWTIILGEIIFIYIYFFVKIVVVSFW